MGYWSELKDKRTLCTCGHPKRNHHYIRLVGDNTGKCLSRGCGCTIYEEGK